MASWDGGSGVTLVCDGLTGAGKAVLVKAIKRAGWSESQFAIARADDIPMQTRAVVAMGDGPLKALTGWEGGKRAVKYTRGYLLPSWSGWPVIPTFDPSKVALGQMKLLGLLMNDIGVALQAAAGARSVCVDPKAVVDYRVGIKALRELYEEALAHPELVIAFDLETETSSGEDEDEVIEFSRDADGEGDSLGDDDAGESDNEIVSDIKQGGFSRDALDIGRATIRTVQFSLRPGTGVSCDWSDEAARITQQLMDLPNKKIGQNIWMFDEPILRNHGIRVPEGTTDLMWMAHAHQPDLPKHLQAVASWFGFPFAWKHMAGPDLMFYGSVDVDACQYIYARLPKQMQRMGTWDGYVRYVEQFRPVLADLERRGIPVDKDKLEELRGWLREEIGRMEGELQPLISNSLKGCNPKEGYANIPDDVKQLIIERHPNLVAPVRKEYKNGTVKYIKSKTTGKDLYKRLIDLELDVDLISSRATLTEVLDLGYELREFAGKGKRLCEPLDFNPRSSIQILEYLKAKRYPIPKKFHGGQDTTGDKELTKLEVKTKDPVLTLTRSIRAYGKLENGYAGKQMEDGSIKGGWQPGPDGRLRATLGFGPATWQLNAKNPNVMTTVKRRKDLAQRFRKCIVAPPGHKLIEFDFKSFHSLTTALESRDKVMYRLAPLDVHSFVAGHMVKFPGIETCLDMSDTDLEQYLEEIKKQHKDVREFQAKPAGHGTNFGQKARRLYFEYSEHFANEAAAQKLLDLMRALFSNLFKWQDWVVEEADRTGRLISKWGAIRFFWDAMAYRQVQGQWKKTPGKGAPAAMAFLPSNDAHGMFRFKVLGMREQRWDEKFGLCNLIHDALLFCCPDGYVEECIAEVKPWLEAPVEQLKDEVMCPEGFRCMVDSHVGQDWASMEAVK